MSEVIGVFGQRGGGTSAIAGVVHLLGYPFYGKPKTLDDNDLCYSDDRLALIKERTEKGDWMFKHPFLTQYIPYLKDHIPTLKCIYVFRDPVATSVHGGGKTQLELITDDWKFQEYMLKDPDALYISYERAIMNPQETVATIAEYLEKSVNPRAIDWLDPSLRYRDIKDYE